MNIIDLVKNKSGLDSLNTKIQEILANIPLRETIEHAQRTNTKLDFVSECAINVIKAVELQAENNRKLREKAKEKEIENKI